VPSQLSTQVAVEERDVPSMSEHHFQEIQRLTVLGRTGQPLDRVKSLHDAAQICMKKKSEAKIAHVISSYELRAAILIDLAEKIKGLLQRDAVPKTRDGVFDLTALDRLLQSASPTSLAPIFTEPENSKPLSNSEKLLVLRSGNIYGQKFKLWNRKPIAEDFEHPAMFIDHIPLSWAPALVDHFDSWQKADRALPPPQLISKDIAGAHIQLGPIMKAEKPINLVQDAAFDCSLVAGLCALVGRVQRGFDSVSI
jgi:hypothetical protein